MKFFLSLVFLTLSVPLHLAMASTTVDSDGTSILRKAFVDVCVTSYAPSDEVTADFIKYSDCGTANDVLIRQLYTSVLLPDGEIERLLENFDEEKGCWKDIDYTVTASGRWPASRHVTRLYALAKLYRAPEQKWEGSERISAVIHSGLEYWFETMPECVNWWHNEIGVPKNMGAVLLMLRDELSEEEIEGGLAVMEHSRFGRTGQNKVWLAGNVLMKALLIDDDHLVREARDYMAEEICVTSDEGIQEDWSFHQHGPQMQLGNYGLAFADVIAFWTRIFAGTEYMFSDFELSTFNNYVRGGVSRCVYRGMMDPSFCGRQNFLNGGRGKACALSVIAANMAEAMTVESSAWERALPEEPGDEEDNESYKRRIETLDDEAAFYSELSTDILNRDDSSAGTTYFERSDCGIYHRPRWYSSVRMHSDRTVGFEFTNRENTMANFSADGALLLMQEGDEYENIFAYWDWRKVPGVTAYDDGHPIKCDDSIAAKRNNSPHVGGAILGEVMATSMELSRDGLHALKSNFFFTDCIVSLGADIKAYSPHFSSVTTSVDQTHLKGEIIYCKSASKAEENQYRNVSWVYHNGRGYISLDDRTMCVSDAIQKGKWDDIEPSFKDRWDEGRVFKCWFEHPLSELRGDSSGSYAYAVLPCTSDSQVASVAKKISKGGKKIPIKVLSNTADCQAVLYDGVLCAAVHRPGKYNFQVGSEYITIDEEKPCILIRDGGESKIVELKNE